MQNVLIVASILISLIAPVVGVRAILKGEYKPQRITRLIFLIVTSLFVLTLLAQNDRTALFLAFAQFFGSLCIFVLSLKYGVGGTSKMDIIVFICAMGSLIVWKTTDNAVLGLYASILTDFIGFLPTLIKAWRKPSTEVWLYYACDVVAGLLNILALKTFLFNEVVFPVYILLVNLAITLILLYKKRNITR